MSETIPVVLFAYARPQHLARVLSCLREDGVPRLEVFADGAKGNGDEARVAEVRAALRAIDWCDVRVVERGENWGLGRNVLDGVTQVAARDSAFIVWEDDLIAVKGTYGWLSAALRHFAEEPSVMSITGWTHPRVTPNNVGMQPYFDGRAECWVWGAWARSWRGMTEANALMKLAAAERRGVPRDAYGSDLKRMALVEEQRNIWAVRWLYHHLQHKGLCVRPPWSMVEHTGIDSLATNAAGADEWASAPLPPAPPVPLSWPVPREHPECRGLWQAAVPSVPRQYWRALRRRVSRWWHAASS